MPFIPELRTKLHALKEEFNAGILPQIVYEELCRKAIEAYSGHELDTEPNTINEKENPEIREKVKEHKASVQTSVNKVACPLCTTELLNNQGLSTHLAKKHKRTLEEFTSPTEDPESGGVNKSSNIEIAKVTDDKSFEQDGGEESAQARSEIIQENRALSNKSKSDGRKNNKGSRHRKSYSKEVKRRSIALRDTGLGVDEIARILDTAKSNVEKWCSIKSREKILAKVNKPDVKPASSNLRHENSNITQGGDYSQHIVLASAAGGSLLTEERLRELESSSISGLYSLKDPLHAPLLARFAQEPSNVGTQSQTQPQLGNNALGSNNMNYSMQVPSTQMNSYSGLQNAYNQYPGVSSTAVSTLSKFNPHQNFQSSSTEIHPSTSYSRGPIISMPISSLLGHNPSSSLRSQTNSDENRGPSSSQITASDSKKTTSSVSQMPQEGEMGGSGSNGQMNGQQSHLFQQQIQTQLHQYQTQKDNSNIYNQSQSQFNPQQQQMYSQNQSNFQDKMSSSQQQNSSQGGASGDTSTQGVVSMANRAPALIPSINAALNNSNSLTYTQMNSSNRILGLPEPPSSAAAFIRSMKSAHTGMNNPSVSGGVNNTNASNSAQQSNYASNYASGSVHRSNSASQFGTSLHSQFQFQSQSQTTSKNKRSTSVVASSLSGIKLAASKPLDKYLQDMESESDDDDVLHLLGAKRRS